MPLAFVKGIHPWPVVSPHKGPEKRKMFPLDDVIMYPSTSISTSFSTTIAVSACATKTHWSLQQSMVLHTRKLWLGFTWANRIYDYSTVSNRLKPFSGTLSSCSQHCRPRAFSSVRSRWNSSLVNSLFLLFVVCVYAETRHIFQYSQRNGCTPGPTHFRQTSFFAT